MNTVFNYDTMKALEKFEPKDRDKVRARYEAEGWNVGEDHDGDLVVSKEEEFEQ